MTFFGRSTEGNAKKNIGGNFEGAQKKILKKYRRKFWKSREENSYKAQKKIATSIFFAIRKRFQFKKVHFHLKIVISIEKLSFYRKYLSFQRKTFFSFHRNLLFFCCCFALQRKTCGASAENKPKFLGKFIEK